MTVDELKAAVGQERDVLKTKSGICAFSENGPIGIGVINALVETIESLQKQIDELKLSATAPCESRGRLTA